MKQVNQQQNNSDQELKKYEIDKKYEVQQNIAENKLNMLSTIPVGSINAGAVSVLADKFSKGGDLIPKEFQNSPEKCFLAIYKGAILGLDPFTALQRIAVVNGRATIWGDTALALVRNSGKLKNFKEEIIIYDNNKIKAVCTATRVDTGEVISNEFSQDDATQAGLWGRNVWKSYPERMLKYRARAFTLRDGFADILDGLHLKEEMEGEQILDVTPLNNSASTSSKSKTANIVTDINFEEKPDVVVENSSHNSQEIQPKQEQNNKPQAEIIETPDEEQIFTEISDQISKLKTVRAIDNYLFGSAKNSMEILKEKKPEYHSQIKLTAENKKRELSF